jgi:hypothetical protein
MDLDSDHWAIWRLHELRSAGENAGLRIECRALKNGGFLFEVTIRRADGTIERAPETVTVTLC